MADEATTTNDTEQAAANVLASSERERDLRLQFERQLDAQRERERDLRSEFDRQLEEERDRAATTQAAIQRIRLAVGRAIAVDDEHPLTNDQVAKAVELIAAAAAPIVPGLPNLIREL
jgi:hypothetical protein